MQVRGSNQGLPVGNGTEPTKRKANEVNTATESVTAGPWHVEKFGGRYEVWRKDDGTTHTYVAVAQRQVDARLIAAAPELLEACKLLYDGAMESSGFAQSTTAIKARAAIAKADGSLLFFQNAPRL